MLKGTVMKGRAARDLRRADEQVHVVENGLAVSCLPGSKGENKNKGNFMHPSLLVTLNNQNFKPNIFRSTEYFQDQLQNNA